jgi:hypothetical protein
MNKKRINLLQSRYDYQKIEKIFLYIRYLTFFLIFIFFVLFVLVNLTVISYKKKFDNLSSQKIELIQELNTFINDEAKINLFQNKYQVFSEFLNEDAQFLPYYHLLTSSLKSATPEPTLVSFKINKEKYTEFTLSFSNFEQMINFFNFIENENFLNKFENIVLNGFSSGESKIQLTFKGKFISLKNEK